MNLVVVRTVPAEIVEEPDLADVGSDVTVRFQGRKERPQKPLMFKTGRGKAARPVPTSVRIVRERDRRSRKKNRSCGLCSDDEW
jgi:hypothetical protein